jgi:hypothetical protein
MATNGGRRQPHAGPQRRLYCHCGGPWGRLCLCCCRRSPWGRHCVAGGQEEPPPEPRKPPRTRAPVALRALRNALTVRLTGTLTNGKRCVGTPLHTRGSARKTAPAVPRALLVTLNIRHLWRPSPSGKRCAGRPPHTTDTVHKGVHQQEDRALRVSPALLSRHYRRRRAALGAADVNAQGRPANLSVPVLWAVHGDNRVNADARGGPPR